MMQKACLEVEAAEDHCWEQSFSQVGVLAHCHESFWVMGPPPKSVHSLPPCPLLGAHDYLGCSPLYASPPLPSSHLSPLSKTGQSQDQRVQESAPRLCGKTLVLVSLPL